MHRKYEIVSVSPVMPVYNQRGRIKAWKVSASYEMLHFLSSTVTKTSEYEFRDLFGWGFNRAWQFRIKCIAELDVIKQK